MQIVVELDDAHFSEMKAIELIREAQRCDRDVYNEKIAQAMSLLALARLQRGKEEPPTKAGT